MESSAATASEEVPGCAERYHPVKHTSEFISLCAIVLVCFGMVLTVIGFVIPRESGFDPMMNAREMEQIEIYYSTFGYKLDICILVGVGLLSLGGVIMSALLMKGICCGEFTGLYDNLSEESGQPPLGCSEGQKTPPNYGSANETPPSAIKSKPSDLTGAH